jgi:ribosomal protein L37AE/L43A
VLWDKIKTAGNIYEGSIKAKRIQVKFIMDIKVEATKVTGNLHQQIAVTVWQCKKCNDGKG